MTAPFTEHSDGKASPVGEQDTLREQAEALRASGFLGRPGLLLNLFNFLYGCSVSGRAPKEIEVALEAFGKDASFDVTQDALVRVYVHKLRRKLEEYYAGLGARAPARIVIPKGAYRLAVEMLPVPHAPPAPVRVQRPPGQFRKWLAAILVISFATNVALISVGLHERWHPDAITQLRHNRIWKDCSPMTGRS